MGIMDELDIEIENAEAWIAEEGDSIVGIVTRVDTYDSGHGYGAYPVITIDVTEGTVGGKAIEVPCARSFHAQAKVASDELGWDRDAEEWGDRKVHVGGEIGAKFVETRQGKDFSYAMWRVICKPPPSIAEQLDAEVDPFTK
jgi:hypothetical protein